VICYFDTSAFVPVLIDERSSKACRTLWELADSVVTSRLLYVETVAALARAKRAGRLEPSQLEAARRVLDQLWVEFQVVELDENLSRSAADLAVSQSLRGYDAVHCAAVELLADDDLVAASGDRALLAACRSLGVATADVNDPDYL